MLLGASGTGKSTLGTELVRRFLAGHPRGRVYVVDSKPRYRAEWTIQGIRPRYSSWVKGDTLRGSVAINDVEHLRDAELISRCCVFQSIRTNGQPVDDYEEQAAELAQRVFRSSGPRRPTLLYVDETYDLAGPTGLVDRRLLRTVRAGRERDMAVLMGAQRPRSIPLPILTEATKVYAFRLEFLDDRKYLVRHGMELRAQPQGHAFVLAERRGGVNVEQLLELHLRES